MERGRLVSLGLTVVVAVSAGLAGMTFGAGGDGPATDAGLVRTYSELATILLAGDKTEASLVRQVVADAYRQAASRIGQAAAAYEAGEKDKAAALLERAAEAAAMVANEGDEAVAGVRNRLLKGGHHHHPNAGTAAKYEPGFVIVDREEKAKLLSDAGAIARLAAVVRQGVASVEAIRGAGAHLAGVFEVAVK